MRSCVQLQYFFSSYKLPKRVTVTILLLFGHITLWDISLYFVEWGTFVVIRQYGQHALDTRRSIIHSNWFGLPTQHLWYYLQSHISAGAKFHPLPPPRHSHRGGDLAHDHRRCEWGYTNLINSNELPPGSILEVNETYLTPCPLILYYVT